MIDSIAIVVDDDNSNNDEHCRYRRTIVVDDNDNKDNRLIDNVDIFDRIRWFWWCWSTSNGFSNELEYIMLSC